MEIQRHKRYPLDYCVRSVGLSGKPIECLLLHSKWQAANDPDSDEEPTEDHHFRYDGRFASDRWRRSLAQGCWHSRPEHGREVAKSGKK
jgi:hypothetical protein